MLREREAPFPEPGMQLWIAVLTKLEVGDAKRSSNSQLDLLLVKSESRDQERFESYCSYLDSNKGRYHLHVWFDILPGIRQIPRRTQTAVPYSS